MACAGQLGVAAICFSRSARSPLALPLALLCLALFGWTLGSLGYGLTGDRTWHYVDVTWSPLVPPLTLLLVAAFVGRRRALRFVLLLALLASGALSLVSLCAVWDHRCREFEESAAWGYVYIALTIPMIGLAARLLLVHLRTAVSPAERIRTHLFLAAMAIAFPLGATELLAAIAVPVPRLGHLATLVCAGVLATVVLRWRLLEQDFSWARRLYAIAVACLAVLGYLAVGLLFETSTGLFFLAAFAIAITVILATARLSTTSTRERTQAEQMSLLGRMADQMAHDLRNPLAAMKGAIQLLQEERARGHSIDEHGEFIDLLANEIDRVSRLVDSYRRLGRTEPVRQLTDVDAILRQVVALRALSPPDGITVRCTSVESLPPCMVDPDLLITALENLIRNAYEAMPGGGQIEVAATHAGGNLEIRVRDDGIGMDARNQERAFDAFYTTKATGSGLGLAFVKRFCEAHNGRAEIRSVEGQGTEMTLRLPVE